MQPYGLQSNFSDYEDFFNYDNKRIKEDDEQYEPPCYHEWKPILLIYSTVWNCKKCDIKREKFYK